MTDMTDQPIVHRGCFVCGQALVSDGHIRDCVMELKQTLLGFRRMVRNMHILVPRQIALAAIEGGRYERASGNAQCKLCGLELVDHPQVTGYPTFHVICDHSMVKL